MRLPKHIMPTEYFDTVPKTDIQITALPFYIKEVGYCNDRKFVRGAYNNYSDYLFVYSLCTMKFKKNACQKYTKTVQNTGNFCKKCTWQY